MKPAGGGRRERPGGVRHGNMRGCMGFGGSGRQLTRPPVVRDVLVILVPDASHQRTMSPLLGPLNRLSLGLEAAENTVDVVLDNITIDGRSLADPLVALLHKRLPSYPRRLRRKASCYCFFSGVIGVTGCEPPVDFGPGVTSPLSAVESFDAAAVVSEFGFTPFVGPLPASSVDTAPFVGPLPASAFDCAKAGADRPRVIAEISKLLPNKDMRNLL